MSLEPKKMKVGELREALEARGLGTSGLKTELIHRLEVRAIMHRDPMS